MTALHHLPDEILLEITSQLPSIKDLAALSAQCRRLNHLIDIANRSRFHRIRLRKSKVDTVPLLMDILKQPKLGLYVRQLEINTYHLFGIRVQPFEETETEDAKLIAAGIRAAGFPDDCKTSNLLLAFIMRRPSLWRDDPTGTRVLWGFYEAMGTVLMSLCPNIEVLKVGPLIGPLEEFMKRANSKRSPSGHLRNLREIRVMIESYDERFYQGFGFITFLSEVHRLPSIKSISVKGICSDENDLRKLPAKKSNISKVSIEHALLSQQHLKAIITHSKSLEEFKYTIGGRSTSDGLGWSISPRALGKALQQQKLLLQVLDLDCGSIIYPDSDGSHSDSDSDNDDGDDGDDDDDDEEEEEGSSLEPELTLLQSSIDETKDFGTTIGSFHDFSALTHLSIGVNLLLGQGEEWHISRDLEEDRLRFRLVDRLPPNLEFLCLRGFKRGEDKFHTEMVDEMMGMSAVHLPCLKEVRGVDEYIPSAETVEYPDDNEDLLFEDTDSWASNDSSDNDGENSNNGSDGDD